MTYVSLKNHSEYSIGLGAMRLKDIPQFCESQKIESFGLTDTNSLSGIPEFTEICKKHNIRPIIGTTTNLLIEDKKLPICLLAANQDGYNNLVHYSSLSWVNGEDGIPFLKFEDFQDTKGLIALSGGASGPIGYYLAQNKLEDAEQCAYDLQKCFNTAFALEISRMGSALESAIEENLIKLSIKSQIPLVATNEAYYFEPKNKIAQDALMCISHHTVLHDENRKKLPHHSHFRTEKEMEELFQDLPQALENTKIIAQQCSGVFIKKDPTLPQFPDIPKGLTDADYLRQLSYEGLLEKFKTQTHFIKKEDHQTYEDRLKFELDVIINMGFPGYFLIVSDFIKWAKNNDIPVGPGRGSGAGSLVAWVLSITDLNPLEHGLLFERFLNPDRVSMPDFDIDFSQLKRDQVFDYVRNRYNKDNQNNYELHVAQISTHIKLKPRAAVNSAGRVMGLGFNQVQGYVQLIPNDPANPQKLKDILKDDKIALYQAYQNAEDDIKQMFDIAIGIEDLISACSTHAAGVVISKDPILDATPMMRDEKGSLITQYTMKNIEKDGQVKFDFLGLKTLDAIANTVKIMKEFGVDIDINKISYTDEKTYQTIASGDTYSVFQIESSGMIDAIRLIKPTFIGDITAILSLYRPGPMENIPDYAMIKNKEKTAHDIHPILEKTTSETNSIIIYQEQVMQIARDMAGYTLGQADLLRRAMGKKIRAEMDQQREIFMKGAIERGVSAEIAKEVFDHMAKFADYGFNKSHAAAYAIISYQTAWLKTYYRDAFMAASLNLEINKIDDLVDFVNEVRNNKQTMTPPDVNESEAFFTIQKNKNTRSGYSIRYGLAGIKKVGLNISQKICEERHKNGKFKSCTDFIERCLSVGCTKSTFEYLIYSGATDSLNTNRGAWIKELPRLIKDGENTKKRNISGQGFLFDFSGSNYEKLQGDDLDNLEKLELERESLGFFWKKHPLENLSNYKIPLDKNPDKFYDLKTIFKGPIDYLPTGKYEEIDVPVIIMRKPEFRKTKKGDPMAIFCVSGPEYLKEIFLFKEKVIEYKNLLKKGQKLILTGNVSIAPSGERNFWVNTLTALEDLQTPE